MMRRAILRAALPVLLVMGGVAVMAGQEMSYPAAVSAQEPMRTLTVTGRGSSMTPATIAEVQLGVEISGRSAEQVQQEVAQRAAAVVELLRSQSVENLQTTGIRLNPRYRYDNGDPEITGYVGSNTVSFRMATDAVGPLLDRAIAAGATQIQGISFTATDEAIASARETALQQATQDAQRQANAVLSSLNLGAQEIVSIQIDGARQPIPVPLAAQARLESASADVVTPVEGGEQTVQAAVTLQIRY